MSGKRWALLAGGLVVVSIVVWRLRVASHPASSAAATGADRVIPVVVVPVEQRDVPLWLEGLGSVTPLQTITVKSQVDGRLDKVLFKEGQSVEKGTVLAQIDPRPFIVLLHQAEAALARDRAQLKNGQLTLERYTNLSKEGLIPLQQLSDQTAAVAGFEAAVLGDRAQLENARLQLDYARITSPIAGITGVRLVDPGNIIHAIDPSGVVVLTQIDPMAVVFTLPQDDLARVAKASAQGKLRVEAWSRDGSDMLGQGELTAIDNQVNPSTSTIRLKATLPNPDRALWPNAFVKARILVATERGAVVVPTPAVQRGPQGPYVYVVEPGDTAAMRPIEIRSTDDTATVVGKGVSPNERVVIDGQSQLKPGAKTAPRAPDKLAGGTRP